MNYYSMKYCVRLLGGFVLATGVFSMGRHLIEPLMFSSYSFDIFSVIGPIINALVIGTGLALFKIADDIPIFDDEEEVENNPVEEQKGATE